MSDVFALALPLTFVWSGYADFVFSKRLHNNRRRKKCMWRKNRPTKCTQSMPYYVGVDGRKWKVQHKWFSWIKDAIIILNITINCHLCEKSIKNVPNWTQFCNRSHFSIKVRVLVRVCSIYFMANDEGEIIWKNDTKT